jgi:hypothetical protein
MIKNAPCLYSSHMETNEQKTSSKVLMTCNRVSLLCQSQGYKLFFNKDYTADQKAKYFAMLWYFLTYLRFTYPTCCSWPLYMLHFEINCDYWTNPHTSIIEQVLECRNECLLEETFRNTKSVSGPLWVYVVAKHFLLCHTFKYVKYCIIHFFYGILSQNFSVTSSFLSFLDSLKHIFGSVAWH